MISFTFNRLFRTQWIWFSAPHEVEKADEVIFLDYSEGEYAGFRRKEGMTTIIDLTQKEEALWEGMREKFVRKQIRRGEALGISVREGTLQDFAPLYTSLRTGKQLASGNLQPVARVGTILIAEYEELPIAGGLFVGDGTYVRAYALASLRLAHAAKDGRMREIIGYGNRVLLWEAMKRFKREGYRVFDLGGVNPVSDNPEDRSLAEFKEAFGGTRAPYFFYRKTYSPLIQQFRRLRRILPL